MKHAILAAVGLATVISIAPAWAQSDIFHTKDNLSIDERIARALQDHRGVVILDAVLMVPSISGDTTRCTFPRVTLGASPGDPRKKTINASSAVGEGKRRFGAATSLPPGEHLLLSIDCPVFSEYYSGPHAKFQLRAGEILNVGTLRINHQKSFFSATGKMHRSVEDLDPEVLALLKANAPGSMTKVVKRPMAVLGPADTETRSRGRVCVFSC